MKVFINDLLHSLHAALASALAAQSFTVVGSVATEADLADVPYTAAPSTEPQAVKTLVAGSDTIVLSLHSTNTSEVDELLALLAYMDLPDRKRLILLSSVLAWARTEGPAPATALSGGSVTNGGGGSVIPMTQRRASLDTTPAARKVYTEDQYTLRRPAASWAELRHLETQAVVGQVADRLHSMVLATGLVYDGRTGGVLKPLFRDALARPFDPLLMPAVGAGANELPTIHTNDLVRVVVALIAAGGAFAKPYMLAAEPRTHSLSAICLAISQALTAVATVVPMDKATFQDRLLTDPKLPELQADLGFLSFEGGMVQRLVSEGKITGLSDCYHKGLVECMPEVARAYVKENGLPPLKVVVVGPPAAGKTTLAKAIAERFRLLYLGPVELLQAALVSTQDEALKAQITAEVEALQAAPTAWRTVREELVSEIGPLVLRLTPCMLQGYVLEGVLNSAEAFKSVFAARSYGESLDPQQPPPEQLQLLADVAPTHVLLLDAPDVALTARASGNEEFAKLLAAYRKPTSAPLPPGWAPPQPAKGKAAPKGQAAPSMPTETLPQVIAKVLGRDPLSLDATQPTDQVAREAGRPLEKHLGPGWREILARLAGARDRCGSQHEPLVAGLTVTNISGTLNHSQSAPMAPPPAGEIPHTVGPEELRDLQAESGLHRQFLLANVMPVLAKALVTARLGQSQDPIEDIAQACLAAAKRVEKRAEAEAFLLYKGAVAQGYAKFQAELARAIAEARDD